MTRNPAFPLHPYPAILSAALLLCGCGGGGDSGGGQSSSSTSSSATSVSPMVAAGADFSLALKQDGTVYAWGDQQSGQLGNGSTAESPNNTPGRVGQLTRVVQIAAGDFHGLALDADGKIYSWGNNIDGRLGLGKIGGLFSTPQTINPLSNIKAISTGKEHSLALRSDGTVWVWGNNDFGQLGVNDTQSRASPTQVTGLNDIKAIAAGGYQSFAIRSNGTVMAWGNNGNGQLGIGSTTQIFKTPQSVPGIPQAIQIAAGRYHTLARTPQGLLLGWGNNKYGQTGQASFGTDFNVPQKITSISSSINISAGEEHSMSVQQDGTLLTWGKAGSGRLGNGTDGSTQSTHIPQVPQISNVISIAAGQRHSLAVVGSTGQVGCFGENFFSQCGRIETTDITVPLEVGPGFNVRQ